MKHIKMPKALADKWLAALRSGEYIQGRETLETHDGRFCCLGVLQVVADGRVEDGEDTPTASWLRQHKITFFDKYNRIDTDPHIQDEIIHGTTLADINDKGSDFEIIAELIEGEVEYTDE